MKHIYTTTLFLCYCIINQYSFSQTPSIEWQKTIAGAGQDDAYDIHETSDLGFIIAGRSYSTYSLDNFHNNGLSDFLVVKLNSNSEVVWQKNFGGSGEEEAYSIEETLDGGFIVAGYTYSNDIDVMNKTDNSADFWILKLDSGGNIQWQKIFGGSNNEFAKSVIQTQDLGYLITGHTFSNDRDITLNKGMSDAWVIKTDQNGIIEWQKTFGGSNEDYSNSIIEAKDGGFTFTGSSRSNNGDLTSNHGYFDIWVVKIQTNGDILWQKSIGDADTDLAFDIEQTLNNEYYVTGYSQSHEPGFKGLQDYIVLKLNPDGLLIWKKYYGGTESDQAHSIVATNDGGAIINGLSDSGNGDVHNNHTITNGETDFWIVKINSEGIIEWETTLGGSDSESSYSGTVTSDGGYVTAGYALSNDGDISESFGFDDVWVVKLKFNETSNAGINLVKKDQTKFSVFPNPTNEAIHLKNWKTGNSILIEDINNKVLLNQICNEEIFEINLGNLLPSGLYFVKSICNETNETQVEKVVLY